MLFTSLCENEEVCLVSVQAIFRLIAPSFLTAFTSQNGFRNLDHMATSRLKTDAEQDVQSFDNKPGGLLLIIVEVARSSFTLNGW